jgi:hypothetical protein
MRALYGRRGAYGPPESGVAGKELRFQQSRRFGPGPIIPYPTGPGPRIRNPLVGLRGGVRPGRY